LVYSAELSAQASSTLFSAMFLLVFLFILLLLLFESDFTYRIWVVAEGVGLFPTIGKALKING